MINGNANIYTLRNKEALLSLYRNPLTLQDLYKPQKTFINSTQNYHSPISQKLKFKGGVLLRDTSITPYIRLPISTNSSTYFYQLSKKRPTAIYGNLTAFCYVLPSLLNSAKFCQDYDPKPILLRVRVNQATKLTIYTPFFPFPYLLSLRNVLILLYSSCTQLNNIYFAIYYHHLYSLRNITLLQLRVFFINKDIGRTAIGLLISIYNYRIGVFQSKNYYLSRRSLVFIN